LDRSFWFGREFPILDGMAFTDPRVASPATARSCCCAKACKRKDASIVGTWKDERNDNTIWTTDLQPGRHKSMFFLSFCGVRREARSSSWDSEHRIEFFECEDGGMSTSRGFAEVSVPDRLC
jgi:hypothetical protein